MLRPICRRLAGRASKDGMEATALLYVKPADFSRNVNISDSMKLYCGNVGLCMQEEASNERIC